MHDVLRHNQGIAFGVNHSHVQVLTEHTKYWFKYTYTLNGDKYTYILNGNAVIATRNSQAFGGGGGGGGGV